MTASDRIDEKLDGQRFKYKNEVFNYLNCKTVYSNIMVFTDKRTLQIPNLHVDTFLMDEVEILQDDASTEKQFLPEKPRARSLVLPEANPVFAKLNTALEDLVSAISNAQNGDLPMLEAKAKMLTSIGNTAVNMENSKVSIIKAISGQ